MENESSRLVLRDLLGCGCVVQDDLGQYSVGSAAHTAVNVVADLSRQNVGIGALCGEYEVDSKSTSLTGDDRESVFYQTDSFFLLLRQTGFVKHLGNLVTGKNMPLQGDCALFVIIVIAYVGTPRFSEQRFSPLQLVRKLGQDF